MLTLHLTCDWITCLLILSRSSCQAEWEKVFSKASLSLVAVRKSFYGSALFLCRSRPPAKQPVFLPVDSTDYKWVETLKVGCISLIVRLNTLKYVRTQYPCKCSSILSNVTLKV